MNPLDRLSDDGIIDLVLKRLKSGKEADVYLVDRGAEVLVAKVYKNKDHRSFKNNAAYKEGRKVRNTRTQRAMNSRSKFGREAAEEAWKNTEVDALSQLHASGVRVPEPVMCYEGVLLMQLVLGPDGTPAPRLVDVPYDPAMAKAHYLDLRGQMIRMLCSGIIHGDLSPYNILHGAEGPTIIDFPQIISAAHTRQASEFFLRDFDNVLVFLSKFNRRLEMHTGDGKKIWQAYSRARLTPDFVPSTSRRGNSDGRRGERRGNEPGQQGDQRSRSDASGGGRGAERSGPGSNGRGRRRRGGRGRRNKGTGDS